MLTLFLALRTPLCAQETLEQRVERLEKLVTELSRQLEASRTNAAPLVAAKAPPSVGADTTGFTIKSGDQNFLLKIGADLQVDNRTYSGTGSNAYTDSTLLRRVRPTFSGTVYKNIDFYFRPDFGLGTTVIYDAYLELRYWDFAKLRVGKFKPPVGLERLQSDDDTSFVERGLPTLLVPSRDIGYQLSGNLLKHRVNYAVGVFNGVPDNSLSDASATSHRDYAARLFLTPFAGGAAENLLGGLGFGVGTTGGSVDGEALPSYKTVGQNTFVTFNSGVSEAGHRTRVAPGAYYYVGPFGLFSEYGVTEEGLQKGAIRHEFAFRAWQVAATLILTGERKSYFSPTPKHSFDPRNGGWGAFELAVRTGAFTSATGLYGYGFLDPTKSPRVAREWVGGGNWYLNRLVRISIDYGNTNFTGGGASAGLNRPAERVLLTRFQINFI
ncbi:MAG TPA: porin [Bryobacteraceae bacterium]